MDTGDSTCCAVLIAPSNTTRFAAIPRVIGQRLPNRRRRRGRRGSSAGLVFLAAHKPSVGNELSGASWVFTSATYTKLTVVAWLLIVIGAINVLNGVVHQLRPPVDTEDH